jgi:hypothetical protein
LDVNAREEAMEEIANRTGGRAFHETNDLLGSMQVVSKDTKATYVLGYYPTAAKLDGRFHTVKVQVEGRSGLRLRYRRGYFDELPLSMDSNARRIELERAAQSSLDAGGIRLTARIEPFVASGKVRLLVTALASDLNFEKLNDSWIAEPDIAWLQTDEVGTQLEMVQESLRITLTADQFQDSTKNGFSFHHDFSTNEKTKYLRILIREPRSALVGSLTVPSANP